MQKTFLHAKLHQARVTGADVDYEGSLAIDIDLLRASGIRENEQIQVYNVERNSRFTTYAIAAPSGSRTIAANGGCAHLVELGDRVIICAYATLNKDQWDTHLPTVLLMKEGNDFVLKAAT